MLQGLGLFIVQKTLTPPAGRDETTKEQRPASLTEIRLYCPFSEGGHPAGSEERAGPESGQSKGSASGPRPRRCRGSGSRGTSAPGTGARRWLWACAAAHGQDAGCVVAAGLQEALQSALEAWGSRPPLAQREDAGRVVARAVQQLVEAAGARLLAAAVGQGLRRRSWRQQRGR